MFEISTFVYNICKVCSVTLVVCHRSAVVALWSTCHAATPWPQRVLLKRSLMRRVSERWFLLRKSAKCTQKKDTRIQGMTTEASRKKGKTKRVMTAMKVVNTNGNLENRRPVLLMTTQNRREHKHRWKN